MSYGEYERHLKACRNRQRLHGKCNDTGRGGDGVTRIGGLVIFVKNAKSGDKNVKIKINSVGSRFANAVVVSTDRPTRTDVT